MDRAAVEESLNYVFTDETWLMQALTHPSSDQKRSTNLNYERLEDLGGERGARMSQKGGKEKFRNNNKNKGNMTFSNKRKQDEAERMRKLQLEIAKKAPVKVQIPDEISVGELASRMKKTAGEVIKCLMKNGVLADPEPLPEF